ncbi:MAG: hypothetical protein BGO67_12405 [Alphaproteobacteria bacterium 41-28]|nr:MAG: hypothetical protein BGO67_12405 [Alphaproteobacteria bacterium 41-28]
MKAKDLSLSALEKKAGLKTNIVQNILRGKSKKPSAEILQAVSEVLECTVKDLLNKEEIFQENETLESDKEILNNKYEHPKLLQDTVKWINDFTTQQDAELTVSQVLTSIQEIYLHSLQTNPIKVDQEFGEWFIDLISD